MKLALARAVLGKNLFKSLGEVVEASSVRGVARAAIARR